MVLVWFVFTLFQFGKTIYNGVSVPYTDLPGSIGLGFRTAAAFIAIVTTLFYLAKKDLSPAEVTVNLRWVVLFMAAYFLFFLPSSVWGLEYTSLLFSREFFIIETGLPCLVQTIAMPTVLVVLFFKLGANKPAEGAIRWGLISAATYILVLWFNYTARWGSEIYLNGTAFLGQSLPYGFEFAITVAGLLFIGIYAAVYQKNHAQTQTLAGLNLRKAGAIITALGLYFDAVWILWLWLGDASGGVLAVWPAFSVLLNVDLWMVALPLVGLPLLFSKKQTQPNA